MFRIQLNRLIDVLERRTEIAFLPIVVGDRQIERAESRICREAFQCERDGILCFPCPAIGDTERVDEVATEKVVYGPTAAAGWIASS